MRNLLLASLLVFGACGGDDGNKPPAVDAPTATPDAPNTPVPDAPPSGANALGQVCNPQQQGSCPAGNSCVLLQGIGSQTMGYCSPMCDAMDTLCSTGYTGPAGSMQRCAISTMQGAPPSLCVIICADQSQCPSGLTCTPTGQQNVQVCVVAQ